MENSNFKKCANCGKEADSNARFCTNCGSQQFVPIEYVNESGANMGGNVPTENATGNVGFENPSYQPNYQQPQQPDYNQQGAYATQPQYQQPQQPDYNQQGAYATQQVYQNSQGNPNFMYGGNNVGVPSKKKSNTPVIIAIIAVVLIVLGIGGYFLFTSLSDKDDGGKKKDSKKDDSYSEASYTEKDFVGAWGTKMKWTELMKLAGEAGQDTSNELLDIFNGIDVSMEMVFDDDNTVELIMSKSSLLDMWDKVVDFYCSEDGVYYIYGEQGYSKDEISDLIDRSGGVDTIIEAFENEFSKYGEDDIIETIAGQNDEYDSDEYDEWVVIKEAEDYSIKGNTIVLGDGSASKFKFSDGNKKLEITDDVTLKLTKAQMPK